MADEEWWTAKETIEHLFRHERELTDSQFKVLTLHIEAILRDLRQVSAELKELQKARYILDGKMVIGAALFLLLDSTIVGLVIRFLP